jgi:hypothetical protein
MTKAEQQEQRALLKHWEAPLDPLAELRRRNRGADRFLRPRPVPVGRGAARRSRGCASGHGGRGAGRVRPGGSSNTPRRFNPRGAAIGAAAA